LIILCFPLFFSVLSQCDWVREYGWGQGGKCLLSKSGGTYSDTWVKTSIAALEESFLGSGDRGCYSHIRQRHILSVPGLSRFSATFQTRSNACHLITSALALPNLIIKQGDDLLFVAVFNHAVGSVVNRVGLRSESNILKVVVNAGTATVSTAYPMFFLNKLVSFQNSIPECL